MTILQAVEVCAGAGGQALGLHRAGFNHRLAVEIDAQACSTLRTNTDWLVAEGDVADRGTWDPADYKGIELFAGGVPCPPFSVAGGQKGSADERDLFAWAIEQVNVIKPRALLLENVRGLAAARFSGYRQRVLDRLSSFGYVGDWRLLQASDYGVPQLRPRFVLVAMRPEDAAYFQWPVPMQGQVSVGAALRDIMAANGWPFVEEWAELASSVGPTIVGGSKKHGGADLGPTRAKQAWAQLGVDGRGIADSAPDETWPHPAVRPPKLTIPMVARLQGWDQDRPWEITGRKTSQYRQIGNAFPPPVAEAIGNSLRDALNHVGQPHDVPALTALTHDAVYKALSIAQDFLTAGELADAISSKSGPSLERRIAALSKDFHIDERTRKDGKVAYRLGAFKGFIGQSDHERHVAFRQNRSKIS